MTATTIMEACFEHLLDFAYSPQPDILFPGIQSETPEEGVWLVPGFFPGEPVDRIWDNDGCAEQRGFFQVLVYFRTRPQTGLIEPSEVADAIVDHFPKGLELGPVRVRKRPWLSPVIVEDSSKSFIPVTISYLGSM